MILSDWWSPRKSSVFSDPLVLSLSCAGNLLTAIAYFVIAFQLIEAAWFFWGRISNELRDLILHAALVIAMCGISHSIDIWVWWHADYMFQGWVTLTTGIVSLSFVIRLSRLINQYKYKIL